MMPLQEERWRLVHLFLQFSNGLGNNNNNDDDDDDEWQAFCVVKVGVLVRVVMTLLMALSCHLLPDLYPGDDVIQFELRPVQPYHHGLVEDSSSSSSSNSLCFDSLSSGTYGDKFGDHERNGNLECSPKHQEEQQEQHVQHNWLQTTVYPFLLKPLTRWDAARFLRLALIPQLRFPRTVYGLDQPGSSSDVDDDDGDPFRESEMAHAFFPLFPILIQWIANVVQAWIPALLLPETYQGILVLSAWILNTASFALAIYSLYRLTETHLIRQCRFATLVARQWATRVSLLFVINPAHVFFVAAYSEALFAALIFTGSWLLLLDITTTRTSPAHWQCMFWIGILCWILASYSRSNGILYAGYLFLFGTGRVLQSSLSLVDRVKRTAFYTMVIAGMFVPAMLHNQSAIESHCFDEKEWPSKTRGRVSTTKPEWCPDDNGSSSSWFYLYPYVQRKYWNVGFLRYFEWKQFPNFLLAAPILILAFAGAWSWIVANWNRHNGDINISCATTRGRNTIHQTTTTTVAPGTHFSRSLRGPLRICVWAIQALRTASSCDPPLIIHSLSSSSSCTGTTIANTAKVHDIFDGLVTAPTLLPHYAVLAVSALVTFTTAHVQIATRLLCSTSPALYWFMASLLLDMPQQQPRPTSSSPLSKKKKTVMVNRIDPGGLLLWYCVLYMFLGVLMHPNWLPWT